MIAAEVGRAFAGAHTCSSLPLSRAPRGRYERPANGRTKIARSASARYRTMSALRGGGASSVTRANKLGRKPKVELPLASCGPLSQSDASEYLARAWRDVPRSF